MAATKFIAQCGEVALSAATAKTILEVVAPTNQRVKILGWGISFDGKNTTILATAADTYTKEPAQVELITGDTAGTFTNTLGSLAAAGSKTSLSAVQWNIQSSAYSDATAEPSATGAFDAREVDPTSGVDILFNEPLILKGGSFVAIRVTSPDAVNARAKIICEE